MKTRTKIAAATIVLSVMLLADIPLLPVQLVPEAQAIFGVRRRTAVVAYSAGAAEARRAAEMSQQQEAAAQQQAPAATQSPASPQQAGAVHSASPVPIGTVVKALPSGCDSVTVNDRNYSDCGGRFYKAAFQGNTLVYVVVERPL